MLKKYARQTMNRAFFENVQPPFLLKSTLDISKFEDYMNSLRVGCGMYIAVLRGDRMQTFKSLYQEVAAALQFPYYFGNNWNALKETCEFFSMPYDEDKEWGRPSIPFHIIMQCQNEKAFTKKFGNIFEGEV
jgi:hypothetical protein